MNVLDILIVALFGAVIAAGFFVGISKSLSAIVAGYFATVMAATFYEPLGDLFRRILPEMNPSTARLLGFLLLFAISGVGIAFIISRTIESMTATNRFAILNNIGGAAIGGIVAAATITLSIAVTVVFVQALAQTSVDAADGSILATIRSMVRGSALAPVFLDLLPYVARVVEPWFPGGLPPILTAVPKL